MTHTIDDFLGGRIRLRQGRAGYRATSDSVLLAACVRAKSGESLLDVGAGGGVVALCVGARVPNLRLTGVEAQPSLALLARENARLNNQAMTVIQGDILQGISGLRGVQFHHVASNPPFYTEVPTRANAEQERAYRQAFALKEWLDFCLKHLRPKGSLNLMHRTESLPELLGILSGRLGALEIIPVAPQEGACGNRVLIRGILGSKKALRLLPPLAMHTPDGRFTPIAENILRCGQGIS